MLDEWTGGACDTCRCSLLDIMHSAICRVAGPLLILLFAFLTLYTSQLLADVYVMDGKRHRTYTGGWVGG